MEKKYLILIGVTVGFALLITLLTGVKTYNSAQNYKTALEKYNQGDFRGAEKFFQKVGRFSVLKPAALYREALC
ncbi:hypothetical protein IJV79_04610, partial [bacterium]|nr:hypothetical protein [bacterium]